MLTIKHIDPDNVTNGQLYSLMLQMRLEQSATKTKLDSLAQEVAENKQQASDMLDTWRTAKGVLSFLKLLAAIGLPVTIIWAYLKGG